MIVVGMGDMKVSNDPASSLITYALGSCIGICIHDPAARVGGILHFMLPEAKISPDRAAAKPFMFADTGIPALFHEAYRLGAVKGRIVVKAAGGAQVLDPAGLFNIGKRNILAMRKILWQNGVMLGNTALGGTVNRTVTLDVGSGSLTVKTSGQGVSVL
ncbi:MAG: chemotaxis protein CheD [Deltaproteobacteria bacterium]|nr:chemotaxis protein CheD [Deltaproteobacteria bacterium]